MRSAIAAISSYRRFASLDITDEHGGEGRGHEGDEAADRVRVGQALNNAEPAGDPCCSR